MSSRWCGSFVTLALLLSVHAPAGARDLKICTEPNNLPLSNRAGEGFENRIADLIAREIGARLLPVFVAQHGPGFIRGTLGSGRCQVLMGLPIGSSGVATTRPYYRATWMFVSRTKDSVAPVSFDDPILRHLRIGVAVVGEGSDTGPLVALGRRGIIERLVRYPIGGDLGDGNDAPEQMVKDVARARTDLAAVWGPFAGYFASRQAVPLTLQPTPPDDGAAVPLTVSIAVAMKPDDPLRDELDAVLARTQPDIAAILAAFNVPTLGN
jgi:mxaJ protein